MIDSDLILSSKPMMGTSWPELHRYDVSGRTAKCVVSKVDRDVLSHPFSTVSSLSVLLHAGFQLLMTGFYTLMHYNKYTLCAVGIKVHSWDCFMNSVCVSEARRRDNELVNFVILFTHTHF